VNTLCQVKFIAENLLLIFELTFIFINKGASNGVELSKIENGGQIASNTELSREEHMKRVRLLIELLEKEIVEDAIVNHLNAESEGAKNDDNEKRSAFLRFGKRMPGSFLRFGRIPSSFLRFG
jgi:hypothetical protein